MRLPTWDELLPDQKHVLEHRLDRPLFVVGPPGSGKTVLAVRRAELAAAAEQRVNVITFNRMLRRLMTLLAAGTRRSKTMHNFVWTNYMARTNVRPPAPAGDPYAYDWTTILATLAAQAQPCAALDHIVIDEGQDLPEGFFQYAARHAARVATVFADDDQALSQRRTTLEQIRAAANLPEPIVLEDNHRNAPEIAAVAEHFHSGRLPAATVRRRSIREVPKLVKSSGLDETAERIALWYEG